MPITTDSDHAGIVHGLEECIHPAGFLNETEEVEVAIDDLVLRRRLRRVGGRRGGYGQKKEKGETPEGSS